MSILARSCLAAAALWLTVATVQAQTQTAPTPQAQGKRLALSEPVKIMTFAVRELKPNDGPNHWYNRREAVYKTINASGADIVLLQDPIKSQVDDIAKNCPGYAMVEGQSGSGTPTGAYAPVLYKAAKYKPGESDFFWFSPSPTQPSMGFGNADPMVGHRVRFTETASGRNFDVYNVKWSTTPPIARELAAKQLARKIVDDNLLRVPFIIGGDFGGPANDPGIVYLTNKKTPANQDRYFLGLWEAFEGKKSPGSYHMFTGGSVRNDLFFLSPIGWKVGDTKVIEGQVDRRFASDHYPVMMTAAWEVIIPAKTPEAKPAEPAKSAPAPTPAPTVTPTDEKPALPVLTPADDAKPAEVTTPAEPAPVPAGNDDW